MPATLGERVAISGQVVDGNGDVVNDAMLEVWQANAAGKYDHPEDEQEKAVDPNFEGFGRVPVDAEGRFDHDGATSSVLYASLFAFGLEKLTHGKSAFVNFSGGMLKSGLMPQLPKNKITIEILEHVEPDDEVLATVKTLKTEGYQIALDDFLPNPQRSRCYP